MGKGFSVVLGMSLAYGVSFFGLLLAYIVYQRNHHRDELWRQRPIGISFFGIVYGYVLPLILAVNALITLGLKATRGWDYNFLIWNTGALICALAGVLVFFLLGRQLWRLRLSGYAAGLLIAAAGTVLTGMFSVKVCLAETKSLHQIGAFITGFIWHGLWAYYLLKSQTRKIFSSTAAAGA